MTYKSSGVDIDKANKLVESIKTSVQKTKTKNAISDIGSFGGLYSIASMKFKHPVLVSSTDGVGTKLLIAQACNKHDTVGADLVAMSANDVATTGAEPLFFLDYVATGKINPAVLKDVISGIALACRKSGYALIGGETAEMPGMYAPGHYDLAGFCVGIAEKRNIIDGKNIKKGDVVLGLESSGLHSNGFSLVRRVFSIKEQKKLRAELLKPTTLYTKPLLEMAKITDIKGLAHITGGAFRDKLPRILPKNVAILINKRSWRIPWIFRTIQKKAGIKDEEMYKVFNMGIGMAAVLSPSDVRKAQMLLNKFNIRTWVIGEVAKGKGEVRLV
ncbi:MAG: phosphoribosylformylglycinamidine cyclo-ligase [Candidatus Omnitrophica bacterium]|nr:phosphoribosylformylglycinamidine cyclo-ligase [Candidatus Omnitrophota bacterium]